MAAITKSNNADKYASVVLKVDPTATSVSHTMNDNSGVAIIKNKNALAAFANANPNNKAGKVAAYLASHASDKVAWSEVNTFFMGNDSGKTLWRSPRGGVCKHSPKAMVAYYYNPKRASEIKEQEALHDGLNV